MSFKSPIKDPNKFVCSEFLKTLMPRDKKISSFLLFSGELEFPLHVDGFDIHMNTNKYVIYEFWNCAAFNSINIANQAASIHRRTHPQSIYHYQDEWPKYKDPYLRSALFFLLNKYSPNGTISHGDVRKENFSPISLETLKRFNYYSEGLKFHYYKEDEFITGLDNLNEDEFLFLPVGNYKYNLIGKHTYIGYETYHVNHKQIKGKLKELNNDFVMVYKNHPRLLEEFKDFNHLFVNKYGVPTMRNELADDVIITNLDV